MRALRQEEGRRAVANAKGPARQGARGRRTQEPRASTTTSDLRLKHRSPQADGRKSRPSGPRGKEAPGPKPGRAHSTGGKNWGRTPPEASVMPCAPPAKMTDRRSHPHARSRRDRGDCGNLWRCMHFLREPRCTLYILQFVFGHTCLWKSFVGISLTIIRPLLRCL